MARVRAHNKVNHHLGRNSSPLNGQNDNISGKQEEAGTQVNKAIGPRDAMVAVLGDEHPSRVRYLGFGLTPKCAFGIARSRSTSQNTTTTTYTIPLEKENQQLREKVDQYATFSITYGADGTTIWHAYA
uniref:Uncharacterized protein n=1 Tax=Nelumbo nucifera TaxID=4432 RepID=A0A822Y0X2_NELNU|nr:TPA_asm: hypothetical protein HUJ06_024751 [Nelumbo nucifera]